MFFLKVKAEDRIEVASNLIKSRISRLIPTLDQTDSRVLLGLCLQACYSASAELISDMSQILRTYGKLFKSLDLHQQLTL